MNTLDNTEGTPIPEYCDLVTGDKIRVNDEGLIAGSWVRVNPAFEGYYYIPDLMAPMRRKNRPSPPRLPTRPRCHRCERYITIDTHADNDLWEEVIGPRFGPGYICADCFTRAADERLIAWEGRVRFVPYSLAKQREVQAEVEQFLKDNETYEE